MYAIHFTGFSVGPFNTWVDAEQWLLTLSNYRSKYSYAFIKQLGNPAKTKALLAEWDKDYNTAKGDV